MPEVTRGDEELLLQSTSARLHGTVVPVRCTVHVMLCGREELCGSAPRKRLFVMALATRLAAATERYWAVFGALALVLSFYDAVWTPVLAMLPLPFPPSAMAWGFVLDALFLAGIAAHAALLTREAWRARLHSASFFVDLACCLPIEALGLAAAGRVMPELRLIKLLGCHARRCGVRASTTCCARGSAICRPSRRAVELEPPRRRADHRAHRARHALVRRRLGARRAAAGRLGGGLRRARGLGRRRHADRLPPRAVLGVRHDDHRRVRRRRPRLRRGRRRRQPS